MSTTRQKILQSTLEITTTEGFHNISISKIAKCAKVSPASIYNHFENKEDMIESLYQSIKLELATAMMENLDLSIDPRTIMRHVWMNVANYYLQNKDKVNFLKYYENTPMSRDGVLEFYKIIQPLNEYIHKITQEGKIRNFTGPVFNSLTVDVAKTLVTKHHNGQIKLTESLLEQTFESVWTGIKAPY